jgi:hypothetical protein
VRVVELTAPTAMTWRGGMPLGLFTGTRTYRVTPSEVGCRLVMRQEYTGPLAGLIGRSIPDLQASFDQFTAGLKGHVENEGPTGGPRPARGARLLGAPPTSAACNTQTCRAEGVYGCPKLIRVRAAYSSAETPPPIRC